MFQFRMRLSGVEVLAATPKMHARTGIETPSSLDEHQQLQDGMRKWTLLLSLPKL